MIRILVYMENFIFVSGVMGIPAFMRKSKVPDISMKLLISGFFM